MTAAAAASTTTGSRDKTGSVEGGSAVAAWQVHVCSLQCPALPAVPCVCAVFAHIPHLLTRALQLQEREPGAVHVAKAASAEGGTAVVAVVVQVRVLCSCNAPARPAVLCVYI